MNIILNINEVHEVANYPYGHLKTRAFFSIEFVKGKGFRSVFQKINPKNGKLSTPQKSDYSAFMYQYKSEENGHIEQKGFSVYDGYEVINYVCSFIANNFGALQLTPEMINEIYVWLFCIIKANAMHTSADQDKLLKIIEPTVDLLVQGIKTNENLFNQINLDVESINRLEKEFEDQKG